MMRSGAVLRGVRFTVSVLVSAAPVMGQAPANDEVTGAIVLTCNGPSVVFDNKQATMNSAYPVFNCRKPPTNPDLTTADVWFVFNPGANTTAEVSLCDTSGLGGTDPGDAMMQVFRLTNPFAPLGPTNMTLVRCADDGCLLDQPTASLTGLTAQNYYVRIAANASAGVGPHEITLACPAPVALNDLCGAATLLSFDGDCAGCVATGTNRFVVYGETRTASVDGDAPGCGGHGNQARGVWYRLVGRGNRVLLSMADYPASPAFDTLLSVYCGDSCTDLGCIAFNDDLSDFNAASVLEFCAADGVTYWVLVQGFGGAVGEFGLSFGEALDTGGMPIECCEPQACGDRCTFTIPPDAIPENGMDPNFRPDEPCVSDMGYTNATQFNDACTLNPPAGQPRRWGFIDVGQTITGTLWSNGGFRDRDWFLYENLPPGNSPIHGTSLIRYSFSSEGPLRPRYFFNDALTDFSDCTPMLGLALQDFRGCDQAADSIRIVDGSATGRTGQDPGNSFAFMVFHNSNGNGYPCGTNDRYWLTLHEVSAASDCPPLSIPMNAIDEAIVPTFSGTANTDGFDRGEPCHDQDPDGARTPVDPDEQCTSGCDSVQRMAGCGASPITDDRFLRISPGDTIAGRISGITNISIFHDIDYYKMEIPARSVVTLRLDAVIPMTVLLTDNSCTQDAVVHGIAATRGRCFSASWIEAPDIMTLEAGTYIFTVRASDAFQMVGNGLVAGHLFCGDPTSAYLLSVNAEPLAPCALACPPGALAENEPCVTNAAAMFDSCAPDNDGCSQAPFTSIDLPSGAPACGTLYSV